jgi:hypothetical protein
VTGGAAGLLGVTDRTAGAVLGAARGALILTRAGCGPCAAYRAEVAALLARGQLDGIAVGALALDRPGASRFKRANPWLAGLRYLPYTVLYRRGRRVDSFAASKGAYLLERTAAAFGPSPVGPP